MVTESAELDAAMITCRLLPMLAWLKEPDCKVYRYVLPDLVIGALTLVPATLTETDLAP